MVTKKKGWQELAVEDIGWETKPRLRFSNAGRCERALAYVAQEIEETDPPDQKSRNRMALGHMAEILIVMEMNRQGWETKHTVIDGGQLEVEIEVPGTGKTLRGHPDGICRHPEFTENLWYTMEAKSMSEQWAEQVTADGIAKVYPHYMQQIGLYGRRLHQMDQVAEPDRGVFAIMDRDGAPLPPERVRWEVEDVDRNLEVIANVIRMAEQGEIPERPYPPSSLDCKFCSYHSLCRGRLAVQAPPDTPHKLSIYSQDPEIVGAAREWREMKPAMDRVKRVLQNASDDNDKINVMAEGVTAGYFQPRDAPTFDHRKLVEMVPGDILRRCRQPYQDRRGGFWIRESR